MGLQREGRSYLESVGALGAPHRNRMPGAASITRAQESVPSDWQGILADGWARQAVCCYARVSPCALPGVPRLPTVPDSGSSGRGALSLRTRKPGLGLENLNGATGCTNPFHSRWGLCSGCPEAVSVGTEVAAVNAGGVWPTHDAPLRSSTVQTQTDHWHCLYPGYTLWPLLFLSSVLLKVERKDHSRGAFQR